MILGCGSGMRSSNASNLAQGIAFLLLRRWSQKRRAGPATTGRGSNEHDGATSSGSRIGSPLLLRTVKEEPLYRTLDIILSPSFVAGSLFDVARRSVFHVA
jgi:hypothetical protein